MEKKEQGIQGETCKIQGAIVFEKHHFAMNRYKILANLHHLIAEFTLPRKHSVPAALPPQLLYSSLQLLLFYFILFFITIIITIISIKIKIMKKKIRKERRT